jgi:putative acetyltransferase
MPDPSFTITSSDPRSAEATALIRDLSAELAERYNFVDDGSGKFRPEDVLVAGSVFLIGWMNERPVACGAVRPLENQTCEVKRMYVVPDCRNQGLAGALLAELERRAQAMGYIALRLETGTHQPDAIRVYERAGYRMIPKFGHYVNDVRSICFEKQL